MQTTSRPSPKHALVVTGLSGSGKSTALRALEDLGYYVVDNLPVQLVSPFLELAEQQDKVPARVALGMDVRAPGFIDSFSKLYSDWAGRYHLEMLFLEAGEEALVRRYSQTRRKHPLSEEPDSGLLEGIRREREHLAALKSRAHQVIDTSRLNVHELKKQLWNIYEQLAPAVGLNVNLYSFGFKYGLPMEADLVMDVRFLPNPYFTPTLRELDGRDSAVVDYALANQVGRDFLNRFLDLLKFLIPQYLQEGRSRLSVAIGCTGGRHRSVAVTAWLAKNLSVEKCRITVRHRDVALG